MKRKPPRRFEEPRVTVLVEVSGANAARLLAEAKDRRVTATTLASQLIDAVIDDNLFAAVLEG